MNWENKYLMKNIIEIVKTLDQYKHPYYLQIIGKADQPPTLVRKFYEGVKSGKFNTEISASETLLGCSPSDQPYQDLKVKLRNRLLNTVFFINTKKIKSDNKYDKIAIRCHKKWTAAKILYSLGAKDTAADIARQILPQARKAEISHMIVDLVSYLRFYYGAVQGNQKKFDHYNTLFHQYDQIVRWENKAQEYYAQLALYFTNSREEKSAIYEKAKSYYEELEAAIYEYKTHRLIFYGGLIKLITHMSINDYETSIEICKEMQNLLDTNPLYPSTGKATFMHQQLICCIQLKLFKEGEELATKALSFLKPGFYNWFKHQELFFLLSTHTKNYQRAYEVLQETKKTKGFNKLDKNSKEIWIIYDMYAKYLVSQDKIELPEGQSRKVRLAKFLNEVPTYSQDKRGMNIAILVIQILFYIQRKDYDAAIDRIEAIEKYCSRYLKRDNDYRSNCFIRMILQLPAARFHPIASLRKAKKYHDALMSQPIEVAKQAHSIEIVPYEDLWEIALGSLDRKGRRRS